MNTEHQTGSLLTIEELAKRIPLTVRGLRFLVRKRAIGFTRIARRLYFREADIEGFLAGRHVNPQEKPA